MARYWKATLVEILFRASVGTFTFFRSTKGQFNCLPRAIRKFSSEMPLSRQMNSNNVSWEPFAVATRQLFCHSSKRSGVDIAACANKCFKDMYAISYGA